MQTESNDNSNWLGVNPKLYLFLFISIVWVLVAFYVGWTALPSASEDGCYGTYSCLTANEWGDYLAGVFAPLAFIWLVATVWIQSDELKEQRRELSLTRKEFELNRKVMEGQVEEAKKQADFIEQQTRILSDEADSRRRHEAGSSFYHLISDFISHTSNYKHEVKYTNVNTYYLFIAHTDDQLNNEKYISRLYLNAVNIRSRIDHELLNGIDEFNTCFKLLYAAEELIDKVPYHISVRWKNGKISALLDIYCEIIMKDSQLSNLRDYVRYRKNNSDS